MLHYKYTCVFMIGVLFFVFDILAKPCIADSSIYGNSAATPVHVYFGEVIEGSSLVLLFALNAKWFTVVAICRPTTETMWLTVQTEIFEKLRAVETYLHNHLSPESGLATLVSLSLGLGNHRAIT